MLVLGVAIQLMLTSFSVLLPRCAKVFIRTEGFVFVFNYLAGDLAFQVLFGPFSEEQRDIIMEVLTSMFCYKHSKVTFKVSLTDCSCKGGVGCILCDWVLIGYPVQ